MNTSCCGNTSDSDEFSTLPIGVKALIGSTLTIIALIAVGGNLLVLLAVFLNKSLRTVTNYFIVSLAFADLLLGILVLPFAIALLVERKWIFGKTLCDIWACTDVVLCTASICSLCAISVDRHIGVTRPLHHQV